VLPVQEIEGIGLLISWFLWIAIALGIILTVASIALIALGKRNDKLLISGFAAVVLGSVANQILNAIVEGISFSEPFGFISAILVSALFVGSILFFALGNPERGAKMMFAAVISAGFFALIPALQSIFLAPAPLLTGSCIIAIDNMRIEGFNVSFDVRMTYGRDGYSLVVDFGDDSSVSDSIGYGQKLTMNHSYQQSGNYVITARAFNGDHSCSVATPVLIDPSPWAAIIPNYEKMIGGALSGIAAMPLNWYYTVPEFDLNDGSDDWKYYKATAGIAMGILGLIFSLRMISGFIGEEKDESIPETLKETVIVLSSIMVAPYLYQVFANICNRISEIPMQNIDFTGFFASIIALIAAGALLGTISSFFGFYAGILAIGLILSNLTAMIRFFLIKGLVLMLPFIIMLYLFPVTRGASQFLISILVSLCIAGPVAAFIIAGLSTTAGPLATFLAPTFAYTMFPYLLSLAMGSSPVSAAKSFTRVGFLSTKIVSKVQTAMNKNAGSPGKSERTFVRAGIRRR